MSKLAVKALAYDAAYALITVPAILAAFLIGTANSLISSLLPILLVIFGSLILWRRSESETRLKGTIREFLLNICWRYGWLIAGAYGFGQGGWLLAILMIAASIAIMITSLIRPAHDKFNLTLPIPSPPVRP